MSEDSTRTITSRAQTFIGERYDSLKVDVHPVDGGYSRNRRAVIELDDRKLFAKEVDLDVLPDDGDIELAWLKKDHGVVRALGQHGVHVVSEWTELVMDGHLLLMPSYEKGDGWHWTLPEDTTLQSAYIQAVIDATKELESVRLPESLTEELSLQPFFRDQLASYDGIDPILEDTELRGRLKERFESLRDRDDHLAPKHTALLAVIGDDARLIERKERGRLVSNQAQDLFNHCDVRSDNIAFNEHTGQVRFVDWNWASYAPAKFGSTEFLIDMARRGVDIEPWLDELNVDVLASLVGFYMIRSLKPPLTPGSTLRDMQSESASIANDLYERLRSGR